MKTLDEIKKGMTCHIKGLCARNVCPYFEVAKDCGSSVMNDAKKYIEMLEAKNAELSEKAARYDELCKRMKKAEFHMFVDKLAVYEKPETYEAAKKFCAEHLARFFLKEGAISFHKVYGVSIYDFLLEAKMQIVMPEPQQEE